MERENVVTMKGNPLTLVGPEIKKGDTAPAFKCVETLGSEIDLESFGDNIKVFNVVVSVDTPVCDVQIRRFNEEAVELSGFRAGRNDQHGSSFRSEQVLRRRRNREGADGVRLPGCFFRRGLRSAYKGKPSFSPLNFRGRPK